MLDQTGTSEDVDESENRAASAAARRKADRRADLGDLLGIARDLLDAPLGVWLIESPGFNLHLESFNGLDEQTWQLVGERLQLRTESNSITANLQVRLDDKALRDTPFPCVIVIRSMNIDRGVLVALFTRPAAPDDNRRAGAASRMFSRWVERTEEIDAQRRVAEIAHDTTAIPDTAGSMQLIVTHAREMTGAEQAGLFLTSRGGTLTHWKCSPPRDDEPRTGELLLHVLEQGIAIRVDDTLEHPECRELLAEGVRSLVSVPVRLGYERIGALSVTSSQPSHFSVHHEHRLSELADCASAALGWWRSLLNAVDEVERAAIAPLTFDQTATNFCEQIRKNFRFEFVALQLARESARLLETVKAVGLAEHSMSAPAKHALDEPTDVQDIQVSIFHERALEIIHGFDPRFDPWLYKTYGHSRFSRAFVPIMIALDDRGELIPDWWKQVSLTEVEPFEAKNFRIKPGYPDLRIKVLGTIEAGFTRPTDIDADTLRGLALSVAEQAPSLWRTQLPYVLESALERATRLIRADSATVHLMYDAKTNTYQYEAASRSKLAQKLKAFPPRPAPDGIGRRAIESGKPQFEKKEQLRKTNPLVCAEGVGSLGAFPTTVGAREGVMYVHFMDDHDFASNEIGWLAHLLRSIATSLRHATAYSELHEQAARLEALPRILSAIGGTVSSRVQLERLVHDALYLLGADVVTLYEYLDVRGRFATPPTLAGRLLQPTQMRTTIHDGDVPDMLIRQAESIFSEDPKSDPLLRGAHGAASFVFRERIEASAGVALRTKTETVGVMFVNYRRRHSFSDGEKQIIETLAAVAAGAICARRAAENAETMAAFGNRVGQLAHDVRSALGRARTELHQILSKDKAVSSDRIRVLSRALDAAGERTDAVLSFRDGASESTCLKETLCEVRERARSAFPNVTLEIVAPERVPKVLGGRRHLSEIFWELVRNAAEHGIPRGGTVTIRTAPVDTGRLIHVDVLDSGQGIAPRHREKVFQLGFTTRDNGENGGFGLWWVRGTLRLHGGDAWVEAHSDDRVGVALRLPCIAPEATE